ncbi:unnamed protein product [Meganyctiphanes norvegica]|uniref:ISXO2-like transposase domain-containing protein n=1 Tax=Meganyctiphanes norvegica TaxID=48144 RepID=A0AAV2S3H5_MEGNR
MESEEYFRRMYEQNGAYNSTVDYSRTYSMPYGENSSVIGDALAVNAAIVDRNSETASINAQHTIKQQQQPHYHQQQQHVHERQHQQLHEQQQQQIHEQQQQQIHEQHQLQHELSSLKSLWMNQRKQFSPLGETLPPPPLKYENVPAVSSISAIPASTPMNLVYIPNNSLPLTTENIHRYPTISQRYSPEPPKIYPPEHPKIYNPDPPVMYNPQPHIVLNSHQSKGYNQEPPQGPQTCAKRILKESELISNKKSYSKVLQGKQCSNKCKDFIDNQEPEPEGEGSKSHNDPYTVGTNNSCTMDRVETPNNEFGPRVKQGGKCIKKAKEAIEIPFAFFQESETETDKIIVQLVAETTSILNVIRWLQQHQLLKSKMKCDHCESLMVWKTSNSEKKWMDKFMWQCENKNCPTRYCTKTIRAGTLFAGSKLCLKKWLHIMYKWIKNVGVTAASEQVLTDRVTTSSYYSFFRESCEAYFKSNPIKIGGAGLTIEMNVCCLAPQRKLNHGREALPPSWFLIIIDSSCIPSVGYMEIVDSTDFDTLLPIILKVVQPGSNINSKDRKVMIIQSLSDKDGTMKQSFQFTDVDSIVHKQAIESYWGKFKSFLAARKGSRNKSALYSYVQEFMWRERFSTNALEILSEQIALQYSDPSDIDNIDSFSLKEETEKKENYLEVKLVENKKSLEELPHKKCRPKSQLENLFIFEEHSYNTSEQSYNDNTDGSCPGEDVEKHTNLLENKSKENTNFMEVPPQKMCHPVDLEGKESSKIVKDYSENQEPEPEDDNIILPLVAETTSILNVIRWLQQHQLLKSEMKCDHCESLMAWKNANSDKKWMDTFFWQCENRNCLTRFCTKTIRAGTVFAGSKLCLKKWLHIMYKWCKNVGPTAASNEGLSNRITICTCYSMFREVCEVYFNANPIKLGGPGISIEIDVSCFRQKRKSNHGHELQHEALPPTFVLGIFDTNGSPLIGYVQIVETADIATLLPIVLTVVQPGSIINNKEWSSYCKSQDLLDKDGAVNQSIYFVDVNINNHKNVYIKQAIESYWSKLKSFLAARKGSKPSSLNSYLQEFMWRERFSDNAFEILCEQIAVQYSNGPSFGDETEKQNNYLEAILGKNANSLQSSSPKINSPRIQKRRQCRNNIKESTEDRELNPEGKSAIEPLVATTAPIVNNEALVASTAPIVDTIRWFQEHQLLESIMKCDHCKHLMTWKTNNSYSNNADGFFWRCENRNCSTFNCTKSILEGSFFSKSLISLPKWFDIMYLWSNCVGGRATSNQVNISHSTILDCYSFFREVCEVYFNENPIKLGGPEMNIVIDVSCFSEKRKRNQGPEPPPPIWVLGIIDSNQYPLIGYMEIVEARDIVTLLPIVLKVVQPGSIIHSKEWKKYREIQGFSEANKIENPNVKFVDITSVHKQTMESYWNKHKNYLSVMEINKRNFLNSYLKEFMWREHFSVNTLEILCEQIAVQYTSSSYIKNTAGICLEKEIKKHANYLEVILEENVNYSEKPHPKKRRPGVRKGRKSTNDEPISQDKVSKDLDESYIENTDDSCIEESLNKRCCPIVRLRRECRNNRVNYYTDDQESEPDLEKSKAPDDMCIDKTDIFSTGKQQKPSEQGDTMVGVNIENKFLNMQHSIFQNEVGIKKESNISDESYIETADDFYMKESLNDKSQHIILEERQCRNKMKDYTEDQEPEPD